MIEFTITKKSTHSKARLGVLKTSHGEISTPAFIPVATQATIKTLTSDEAAAAGSQMLIANTFHLHLKPGEDIVSQSGGIHEFMNWPHPLMTDSGGFQVFSLGFGQDHGVGKILSAQIDQVVSLGQQPSRIKITENGVHFKSPVDGSSLYLDPESSIKIQEKIGADIIFAFDEATSPVADEAYTKQSLTRTHRWAKQSLDAKTSDQALYGIVQGGKFPALRKVSAQHINSLPFDGFGIGGEYGDNKQTMIDMLNLTLTELDEDRPRHLLGIGHPSDIPEIIKSGVDTFDCIAPTHYARHGTAFTTGVRYSKSKYLTPSHSQHSKRKVSDPLPSLRLSLKQTKFLSDQSPLDPTCTCYVCQQYKRSYISHLVRAKEITGLKLLTYHNLHFFHQLVASVKQQIENGKI